IGKLINPRRDLPIVVDPVLQSSSGALLFKGRLDQARDAYLSLSAHAGITPNLLEAAPPLEPPQQPSAPAGGEEGAKSLLTNGVRAGLVKGGHLPGDPVDVLAMGGAAEQFAGSRIPGKVRGTGCRLASALAAGLAMERPIRDAVLGARAYVREYILE